MLREVAHFLWHAPATLKLRATLDTPTLYQRLMQRADARGLARWRHELASDLAGEVLEVGAGSGLMFPHYAPGVRLTAIEPDETFLRLAVPVARQATVPVRLGLARGEALPFADASFDAVVLALVLCSATSPARVLAEVRRVLRPGGQLRLLEHVRSERPVAGWLMDLVDPVWLRLNRQGCHLNRKTEPLLPGAGFAVDAIEAFQVYSPGIPAFPMRLIRARRAGGRAAA